MDDKDKGVLEQITDALKDGAHTVAEAARAIANPDEGLSVKMPLWENDVPIEPRSSLVAVVPGRKRKRKPKAAAPAPAKKSTPKKSQNARKTVARKAKKSTVAKTKKAVKSAVKKAKKAVKKVAKKVMPKKTAKKSKKKSKR